MTDPTERWLPVTGYEGLYEVSDLGRVRSLPRQTRSGVRGGTLMKPYVQNPPRDYPADRFGITFQNVSMITTGRTWLYPPEKW